MLRIELPDKALIAVYQRMSPTERLAACLSTTAWLRRRVEAHVAGANPDWTESQVAAEVAKRILSGR